MVVKSEAKRVTEFKIIGKLQEKAIRIMKFFSDDASVTKEMKELKILKLKDFVTFQNILCVKDSLTNKEMPSSDDIFQ